MLEYEAKAIIDRLDRRSPELLLNSIVSELARLGGDVAALSARLVAMESLLVVADRIAASGIDEFSAAYPTKFTITAAHSSLSAPEFHELEHNNDGTPVRWTGPHQQFSFSFFLDRSKFSAFRLEFDSVYFSEPVDTISCFVDGQDVPVSINNDESKGGFVISGTLPIRKDNGGSILTFVCPSTKSPADLGLPDHRRLGIRFRRLTVETGALAAPVAPKLQLETPLIRDVGADPDRHSELQGESASHLSLEV